jgi:RNA polymerase sigma-70 factor (ECF subfamily)
LKLSAGHNAVTIGLASGTVLEAAGRRRELAGYCRRMLGSTFDADDAVQETIVRAWTRRDSFEGRSSVDAWLYRIATNVCLDMLRSRGRRAVPTELDLDAVEPLSHDGRFRGDDPAELAVTRDAVRRALVAALRDLPARQRAVLILREVLRWSAPEVAELLGTTVVSVNSALQRARATLAARGSSSVAASAAVAPGQEMLFDRYVTAFERHDVASLVTLVRQEAAGHASAA